MVLDGGFGTMVQRYGLKEEDFRGYRYRDIPGMLLGNNEMLNLTRPDVVSYIVPMSGPVWTYLRPILSRPIPFHR